MKVRELLEELQKHDLDALVFSWNPEAANLFYEVTEVEAKDISEDERAVVVR